MLPVTPAALRIDRQALTVLARDLRQPSPHEGCALLLGVRRRGPEGEIWRLRRIWPCLNVWEPAVERTRRFRLDPREQLLAQKWGRARGLEVLGSAHSHPFGVPVPSDTDRALTPGPALMLILGGPSPGRDAPAAPAGATGPGTAVEDALAAWWLPDPDEADPAPRPLVWKMED